LECFDRDLADAVDQQTQAVFDAGTEVGIVARGLYPGGRLVSENHFHHEEAMASTNRLLVDPAIPAIFEAAFQYNDVKIRADVLARTGDGGFDLIEFKSTTKLKDEQIPDISIQAYVLYGSGIDLRHACMGHLNNAYVYKGGDYDLRRLFKIEDVTDQVREMQSQIPSLLDEMRRPLHSAEPPDIEPGSQCSAPYVCPFFGHCNEELAEHSVQRLPRVSKKLLQSLASAGIDDIRRIPPDFPGLSPVQRRICDCVIDDRVYLSSTIRKHLEQWKFPIHFLDFETFNPALPLFVGTRPYQMIPFQWSDHVLEHAGTLRHEQFLHDGSDDPRIPFVESLLKTLGTKGSIVVYTSFEATRIRELAEAFPRFRPGLLLLVDSRVVDLHQLIKQHCYHPKFHGSFSIKNVLPALVPDLGYEDLEINDGGMASLAYTEMRRPETDTERRRALKDDLLRYCARDTEAEVRLFETLKGRRR
jgi:hypothetical protein